jgi:hypothetical protein
MIIINSFEWSRKKFLRISVFGTFQFSAGAAGMGDDCRPLGIFAVGRDVFFFGATANTFGGGPKRG